MEADIKKTHIEAELGYHKTITEIHKQPVGPQVIRLVDVLNAKASALLTHVSIMMAISTGLFAYVSPKHPHPDIVTLALFIAIIAYAGISLLCLRVCPETSSGITKFSKHEAD